MSLQSCSQRAFESLGVTTAAGADNTEVALYRGPDRNRYVFSSGVHKSIGIGVATDDATLISEGFIRSRFRVQDSWQRTYNVPSKNNALRTIFRPVDCFKRVFGVSVVLECPSR